MKYWKIKAPVSIFTYEFGTDDTVTKNEIKEWFKSTYSIDICKVKEVDKSEIDCKWVICLERKGNGFIVLR